MCIGGIQEWIGNKGSRLKVLIPESYRYQVVKVALVLNF